jgi:hypothetical protein
MTEVDEPSDLKRYCDTYPAFDAEKQHAVAQVFY